MALTEFSKNMNYIQTLPDQPTETAEELKQKFDQAGNDIKNFLNETLTKEIDELISKLNSSKISLSMIVNDLTTGGENKVASANTVVLLNNAITDIESTIEELGTGATINISTGTATPTGGTNGDIYIQVF